MRRCRWITLLLTLILVGCRAPTAPRGDTSTRRSERVDPSTQWQIAPGQGARIARMWGDGVALPDGCQKISSSIEPSFARASFRCGSMPRPFELQLRHSSTTFQNVVRARSIAIARVDPMGAPDVLVARLVELVRAHEADFRWAPLAPVIALVDAGALPVDAGALPVDAGALPGSTQHVAAQGPATTPPAAAPPLRAPSPAAPPSSGGNALDERRGPRPMRGVSGWWYQPPPFAEPGGYGSIRPDRVVARLLAWLTDGVLAMLLAALGLGVVLRRQLRESARWVPLALGAITVLGAVLRASISVEAPMNAFAFQRVLPLASQAFHGPVLSTLSALFDKTLYLTSVISWTNFALACLTPPALFAHARYLLRDERSALMAAAMIALLPMHIRFSRSDVQFIASLLSSSLTFIALYGALTERSRRYATAFFVLLPVLSLATYLSRPENIIFAALDGGAILLYANREVPRARRWAAVALVLGAAAWSVAVNLLAHFSHNVQDGLSLRTLEYAARVLTDPARNTLLNPRMTPVGVGLLALAGFVHLWRTGERRRAVFLVTWLSAFFVVHSYVFAEPMMMARYHLHLVSPLILLAAASTPWLLRAPRGLLVPLGLYALAWPLIHLPFERDVNFSEMHELAFLRRVRALVPEDCVVLEFVPATSPSMPQQLEASRVGRASASIQRGELAASIRFVQDAEFVSGRRYSPRDAETLTAEARALLANPPACLMLYEGLTCRSHLPLGASVAPACVEARERVRRRVVAQSRFRARRYDDPNVGRLIEGPDGRGLQSHVAIRDGEPITLTLWRVISPP